MKKVLLIMMMISALALTACGKSGELPQTDATTEVNSSVDAKEDLVDDVEIATTEETATEQTTAEVDTTEKQESDETNVGAEATESNDAASRAYFMYEGEYLDYDYNEPELKICANGDGTYFVYIGIIRLAVFEDVDAIVTDAGLEFTTEDGASNPIKGVITLEGNEAVVTFTDSTWELIPNGTVYRYHRPESQYEGEYLDYEYNEPELKINATGYGIYEVYIGIIRLASFEDDDAILTNAGLEFTAEDDSGNPIKGVITLEGNDAVVTFTDSTWELIPNGTVYRYYRPNN